MKKYIFLLALITFAFSCGICAAQEKWMCGIDLDEDGKVTSLGETAECVTVGVNHICPLDAVYCTYSTTYPPDECPSGTTLNTVSDKCDVAPTNSCPQPYTLVESPSPGGCVVPVVCPNWSSLNAQTDLCEYAPTTGCDPPYVYNSAADRCEVAPSCEPGSTWNATLDRCEKVANATCPPGTAYNIATDLCESVPNCPGGGTYNVALNRCETGLVPQVTGATCSSDGSVYPTMADCGIACARIPGPPVICPIDPDWGTYSCPYDFFTPCSISYPECPDWNTWCCPGQFDGTCSEIITIACPPGYTQEGQNCTSTTFSCNEGSILNTTTSRCEGSPSFFACDQPWTLDFFNRLCFTTRSCAEGTFDNVNDVCFRPYNSHCETGFTYNSASALCVMSPVGLCGSSGCEPADACTAPYVFNSALNRCELSISCEPGSTWNATLDRYEKTSELTCPPGTAYNSSSGLCEVSPLCPGSGTYNSSLDRCVSPFIPQVTGYQCSTNGGVYSTMTSCVSSCPELPGPPLICDFDPDWWRWSCPYDPYFTSCSIGYPDCPSYDTWCCPAQENIIGTCSEIITMVCSPGYTQEGQNCTSTTFSCIEGTTLNPATHVCEASLAYYCAPPWVLSNNLCVLSPSCVGGSFDNVNDICIMPVSCNPDSYSSVFDACTMVPIKGCMEGTVYSPTTDRCEVDPTCDQHSGYEYYPPQDACINRSETTACPIPGRSCVQNLSGDYQCSAECFDTLDEGGTITTGGDDTWLTDDGPRDEAGNCIGEIYIFSGKQMECNKSGHKSGWKNCCLSGEPTLADDVGSGVSMYNMMQGIQTVYELAQITAWAYSWTPSITYSAGTPVAAAVETIVAGGSLIEGFASYAMAAFMNPATLIIAAIILIVQYFILDGSCTEEDMETAMMRDSGRCHEVGEYCSEEWSGMGCVQDTKVLCCFNSKLARIIHEQGRPQLNTFVPTWATILDDEITANCRGFTPAEFQMLDFSKMDLSEYFTEITAKVQSQLEQTVGDRIQDYYTTIQENN